MATIPDILNDSWDGYKREDVRLGLQAKLRELQKTIEELQGSGQEIIDLDAEVDNGDIILTLVVDEENPVNNRSVRLPISTVVAGKLSEDPDTGRLDYSKAPCMVLASMGTSLDGGSRYMMHAGDTFYSEQSNDLIYCKQVARLIHIAPDKAVLYCNAMTGKLYRWNGSGMVEVADKLTNSQASQVMDLIDESMNTGSHLLCLASMGADYDVFDGEAWEYDPQGEELYYDGTFIRRADDDSLMEDPDQGKLYFNLRTRLFYVWDGGTFVNVGSGSGDGIDQGKFNRLVTAINNLDGRVSALIGALANLAFEDEFEDPYPNGPWPVTPSGDKVTVIIDSSNLADALVEGNTSIEIGMGGSVTIAVKPDEGKFLRSLSYAIGEGSTIPVTIKDSTKRGVTFTIANVTSDITVALTGSATNPQSCLVKLPSGLEFTSGDTSVTVNEGSDFSRDVQLVDPAEGVTLKRITVRWNYDGGTQSKTIDATVNEDAPHGICTIGINDIAGNIFDSMITYTTESAGETYNISFNGNELHFGVDDSNRSVGAGGNYSNTIRAKSNFDLVDVTKVSGTCGFTRTLNQSDDSCTIELTDVQSDIVIGVQTKTETDPVAIHKVQAGVLDNLVLTPSEADITEGQDYHGQLSLAAGVEGKRLPYLDEITLTGTGVGGGGGQIVSLQSSSPTLNGMTVRPDLGTVSGSDLGRFVVLASQQTDNDLFDSISYNERTGELTIRGVKHAIYINAAAQAVEVERKVTLKLLNIDAPEEGYADDDFGYKFTRVASNVNYDIELQGIETDETNHTRATLNGDVTVKSGDVVLFRQGVTNNGIEFNVDQTTGVGTLHIPKEVIAALTADIIIEATACTGKIVLTSANAFAFSYIDGDSESVNAIVERDWNGTQVELQCSSLKAIGSNSGTNFLSNTLLTSIDFGGAKFKGRTLARLFDGCTQLERVKGLVVTDTVGSLASMFYGCSSLNEVDTIGWDLSSVVNMKGLFNSCGNLTSVDLGSKDVSSLQYAGSSAAIISAVFYNCTNLENLDVSYWNAPALEDLYGFICNCTKLKSFDASTWNVNAADSIQGMFVNCSGLKSIDISGIDTSVTKNISFLFRGATKLESITIKDFVTSDVENISSMFYQTRTGITLHCKSATVPAVNATDSLNWLKAASGIITTVKVPDGCVEDYQETWSTYLVGATFVAE